MAIHSSTLAWKIPWTEEPDRIKSMGSQSVGHNWMTSLHFTFIFFVYQVLPPGFIFLFAKQGGFMSDKMSKLLCIENMLILPLLL